LRADALGRFSGYMTFDELHEGARGRRRVIWVVDNVTFRRLDWHVFERPPKQAQVTWFLRRFASVLKAKGLKLRGVTDDGARTYAGAVARAFGRDVPRQVCRFHVMRLIAAAALNALSMTRKQWARQIGPPMPAGRPPKRRRRRVARVKRQRRRLLELFRHRFLLVKKRLTVAEQRTWLRVTRGFRAARRLRRVVQRAWRLFDRRRRRATALRNLTDLRRSLSRSFGSRAAATRRFPTLFHGNVARSLCFLAPGHRDLPATSNAVERANRRHRKMQKTVYRVRIKRNLDGRIAMDLMREADQLRRLSAAATLHRSRKERLL
jgi:hypothetical protein